jgi:imidazolonepropionase-like amidohydrolase
VLRRVCLVTAVGLGCACGHPSAPVVASRPTPTPTQASPAPQPREAATHLVLTGARLPGGHAVTLQIRDGVITSASDTATTPTGATAVDLEGRTIMPGFIDSHVHLAYAFGPDAVGSGRALLAERGVVAGVDLAAPLGAMAAFDRERWLTAGPMITAPRGYPTRSWGADGFGLEVSSVPAVRDAVDQLADAGAAVIKVPLEHGPVLRDEDLAALIEHAHARGLKVAAHALGEAQAAHAAELGVDVLAHTPLEPLSDATVQRLRDRAVVSTLMAFGASPTAVDNLRRLHEAGATVLYGTDLGNSPVLGIDVDELALLRRAGLSPREALEAGTTRAAAWWGLPGLGALEPGRAATFVVLDADPLADPSTLARPHAVYVDGMRLPADHSHG